MLDKSKIGVIMLAGDIMPVPERNVEYVITRLNANGRIVIPAPIRDKMGLKPGEAVMMTLEDGVLRLEPHLNRIRRIQEEFRSLAKPGVLASDELTAERRKEAWRALEKGRG